MTTKTRSPRYLRRSAPLLEDVVLHDAKRVASLLIDRLMGGSKLGYRLTDEEQYLLALAARMYKAIQHNEWTADYELKARTGATNH